MDRKKKNIAELTNCSIEQFKKIEKIPLRVLADNVRSMHNIGSLFRTADAFRLDSIILAGISGVPPHPEIAKTALGAENSVKWKHVENAFWEVLDLKHEGWSILVLEQTHNSIPLQLFNVKDKKEIPDDGDFKGYILVVGNEVHGVNQKIIDVADHVLEIPQEGTKHSLNVSTSSAIALFHLYIQLK